MLKDDPKKYLFSAVFYVFNIKKYPGKKQKLRENITNALEKCFNVYKYALPAN